MCRPTLAYLSIFVEAYEPLPDKRAIRIARAARTTPIETIGSIRREPVTTRSASSTEGDAMGSIQTWLHHLGRLKFDTNNQSNHVGQTWPYESDLRSQAQLSLARITDSLYKALGSVNCASVDASTQEFEPSRKRLSVDASTEEAEPARKRSRSDASTSSAGVFPPPACSTVLSVSFT